jgi:hypothetical protein
MAKDCGCGKPKSQPLGRPVPNSTPAKSLVASGGSAGGIFYVTTDGTRTRMNDMLAARAEVIRRGGGSIIS